MMRIVLTAMGLLGSLSALSYFVLPMDAGRVLFLGPTAFAQEETATASDYLPVKSTAICTRNYNYTYGTGPSFSSQIVGSLTAPYTTQPLTGALFCGFAGSPDLTAFNTDGGGLRNIFDGDHYASADCDMTAYPSAGLPASIHDGQLLSFGSIESRQVGKDLAGCAVSGDSDETLLFRIQDVTVGQKSFQRAVVMWFLQDGEAFVPLDFHGKDVDLGLVLPDAAATGGRRAFDFFVLGRKEGIIAGGYIDSAGSLMALFELASVDCSAAVEWDVFDAPGYWHTYARGINDNGDVVGYGEKRDGTTRSFMRRDGVVTPIHPTSLGADWSWANGINNLGDIVGYFNVDYYTYHGYLLRNGVYTQIDKPEAPATLLYGINDRQEVVGTVYVDFDLPDYGFLWRDGVFTEIRVPGATWTQALGLNNNGDVVGNFGNASGTHGFLRSAEIYTVIDYPGAVETRVPGINDDGDLAGTFRETTGGPLVAFGRLKGEYLAIRGPCSVITSNGVDISSKGLIVGNLRDEGTGIRWGFVASHIKTGR